MIKRYVSSYVSKLTMEEFEKMLEKQNVSLSSKEKVFCFQYIKKNWSLLFENREQIFTDLKNNLTSTSYLQIEPILLFYQKKYASYL